MNKSRKNIDKTKQHKTIKHTKKNEDKMPTVEKVNYEMTSYLQDIEEYIKWYKRIPVFLKNTYSNLCSQSKLYQGIFCP